MKRRHWILVSVIAPALLLVGMVIGVTYAQGQAAQGEKRTQATSLGTAFTYQGQLSDADGPVTDDCQMAFRLYDDADAGSQVGDAITSTVPITDSLFTVNLDFGTVFSGEARWLGIKVKCLGDAVYTDLGRQALTAAPYALHALSTGALQGYPITSTTPITAQVLRWNGNIWSPSAAMVLRSLDGTCVPEMPYPQPDDPLPPYPFEFDISALGDIQPSDVIVVASGYKFTKPGGVITMESPVEIYWEVTSIPTLTVQIRVWDVNMNEYDVSDVTNWRDKKLNLNFVASVDQSKEE
jgi:hypothetical protein